LEWLFFLIPIAGFGLGFGTARLASGPARVATLVALMIVPVVAVIAATIMAMPPGQVGRELTFGTSILFYGLPALVWAAIVMLGHDLGRRTSRRHRESRFR
jgi:hypothetical protein